MGTDLLPFSEVTAVVAVVSALGIVLLAPLYLSLRRDVQRLREWSERQPDYAREDLARSESRLDRAEQELEAIYAERGEPVPGTGEQPATEVHPGGITAAGEVPAATRVRGDRPALDRITMEREALVPHPRWRRFVARATQPRWLALAGIVALAIAAVAIVGSERLLEGEDPTGAPLDPSGIEVAVLNATSVGGLAGEVSRTIEDSGFLPGDVTNFEEERDGSVVMFQPGQRRAAIRVARELRGDPPIEPIEPAVERLAGAADVVVIVGADQVR